MSKKFRYGNEIIKFLEKYGYHKRGEAFEQFKDSSMVTYMYAIPQGMRPQTPYVEFSVDADNDAFISGVVAPDGRKGYESEFDSVEDLEWFIENANYSNVDLTEKKSVTEAKVDYQSVLDSVLPKEYTKNKDAYKYALSCVTSLYNEDEYDSDSAKVYFLNCYISDLFPTWIDEIGEKEMDALANGLYDGTFKWKDIDKSWFESKKSNKKSLKESKVMSYEEFQNLCNENFSYAIMDFHEYKGTYFVIISADEKTTEKFAKILEKNGFELAWYKLTDPKNEYYLCYEIMCI